MAMGTLELVSELAEHISELTDIDDDTYLTLDFDGMGTRSVALVEKVEDLSDDPDDFMAKTDGMLPLKKIVKRPLAVAGGMVDGRFSVEFVHHKAIWRLTTTKGMSRARKTAKLADLNRE